MMNHPTINVVPSWDIIEENHHPPAAADSKPNHLLPTVRVDYQVAELTWKDGHLGMHAFGVPKSKDGHPGPVLERCPWDNKLPSAAAGTLESIVNQATAVVGGVSVGVAGAAAGGEQLVTSWFDNQPLPAVNVMSCQLVAGSGTRVGSCSVSPTTMMEEGKQMTRMASEATHGGDRMSSRVEQSGTIHGSQETCETGGGFRIYASASLGSAGGNSSTSSGTKNTVDDHESVSLSQSRNQGKGVVTVIGKRSRCAAVHNQSERKRRDKINQRISTLQKLVPNSSKTDKASMLDEVIEYMKQLQNKVELMSRINMSTTMMLPLSLQQQLHMSFMSSPPPMGSINHPLITRQPGVIPLPLPPPPQGFYPNPFMPTTTTMASWDPQSTSMPTTNPPPTFSAASFLPSQSQPSMTMDAYSRMAAMYHQLQVPAPPPAPGI